MQPYAPNSRRHDVLKDLPRVTIVTTENAGITDAGVARLAELPRLNVLKLDGAGRITDEGLEHVAKMRQLWILDLSFTPVTDAGLSHLAACPRLEYVHLTGCPVSDSGAAALSQLKRLKLLAIGRTRITPDGALQLRKALPGCIVTTKL